VLTTSKTWVVPTAAFGSGGTPVTEYPVEDPMAYLERYRRELLRPESVRLVAETVGSLIDGTAVERPQDPRKARMYRTPDRAAIRELRRRVAARRQPGVS